MVKFILSSLLFLFYLSLSSQDTLNIHTYGNNFENKGSDIIYTSSGEYIVVGSTFNELNQSSDVYVLKLDAFFNKLWSFSYGTDYIDVAKSVVEMPNGNLLIAGYSNKNFLSGYDVYALCLNTNGGFLWEKTYGGSDWDFGYDLIKRYDNTYYICGETKSFGMGEKDAYLIQINDTGLLLSQQMFGGDLNEVFYDMKQASNQSLYLVGEVNTVQDSTDILLVNLDSNDDLIFENHYGSSKVDIAYQLDFMQNGDLALVGSSNSHSNRQDTEIMYYRFASNGDSLFSENFASSFDTTIIDDDIDEGTSILSLNDGSVLTAGYTKTYGFGSDKIALNQMGMSNNALTGNSPDVDYRIYNMIQVNDRIVMVGSTDLLGVGNSDVLLIYADTLSGGMFNTLVTHADTAVVSVEETPNIFPKAQIYPNPVSKSFRIHSEVLPLSVGLYSMNGSRVEVKTSNGIDYDLLNAIPGSYLLQIHYPDGSIFGIPLVVTD